MLLLPESEVCGYMCGENLSLRIWNGLTIVDKYKHCFCYGIAIIIIARFVLREYIMAIRYKPHCVLEFCMQLYFRACIHPYLKSTRFEILLEFLELTYTSRKTSYSRCLERRINFIGPSQRPTIRLVFGRCLQDWWTQNKSPERKLNYRLFLLIKDIFWLFKFLICYLQLNFFNFSILFLLERTKNKMMQF